MPAIEQYGASSIAIGFVAVILIAYIFQWCLKNYRKATTGGLTIDLDDANSNAPNNQPTHVPKDPPTPRTQAPLIPPYTSWHPDTRPTSPIPRRRTPVTYHTPRHRIPAIYHVPNNRRRSQKYLTRIT